MKKIILLCMAFFTMLFSSAFCFADNWDEVLEQAKRTYPANYYAGVVSPSGVKVEWDSTSFGPYYNHGLKKGTYLGTRRKAACITGMTFSFNNTSDNMVVLEWKNSAICLDGNSLGVPFMGGVKFVDAGKPEALTNDILPPHSTLSRTLYIPIVSFRDSEWQLDGGDWIINGAILFKDGSRKFDFYIATLVNNTNTEYIHIDIPPMITPYFETK